VRIELPAHEELLAAFYDELYLPAFAHQREPLETWQAQLRARRDEPYALRIFVEGEELLDPARRRLVGGIVWERYPKSGCVFLTYMVVAPAARRRGLGQALLGHARAAFDDAGGAALVLGEVADPRAVDDPDAWSRLERFERWGARVLDVRYVQPDLGFGRDRHLLLVAFDPPPRVDGARVRAWVEELYDVVEGGPPDADVRIPDDVGYRRMSSDPRGS
jgi:GNAT superfamily N-acetyltransferase